MQQACFDSHTTKSRVDPDRQCLPTETRQEPEVSTHMRTKVGVHHAEIKDEPTDVVITAHTDSYSNAESMQSVTPHPATPPPAAASYKTRTPGNSSDTVCDRAASMPKGTTSNSNSNMPDVRLPATPSSKLLSVTSQQPTTAKSKSNSSLSSESVFVENTVNTAELGENSNNYVPIFLDSTQVYTGVHKTQSSKNYKDGQFPCEICKTCVFRSRHDLKMHMRQHKDEKPYKCSHCSYRSKHNANLKLHIAHRHSNARPFHCPVCSHTSKSSSDLRKHMIVHSGKKRTKKK